MRAAGWLTALIVVTAVVGVAAATHRPATTPGGNAGQRSAALVSPFDGGQPDPPHVLAAPSPSPTSAPTKSPARPSAGGSTAPRTTAPSIVVRSTQQSLINRDRAAHGLPPLTWSSCLYNVAVSNAKRIAGQGYLSHTNGPQVDLSCGLGSHAGENIGWWSQGINDSQLNTMFMNSPEHYANIMGPYHYVATAWIVASNGYGYIAVEFS